MAQMLRIFSLAAIALGLYAADGVTVEGAVVNSVTGAGMAGVTVEMSVSAPPALKYRTQTDSAGEFRFLEVAPGEHSLSYEKDGFDSKDGEDNPMVRVPSRGSVQVRQELDPLTSLYGKVFDEENHPLKRIMVELLTGRGQVRGHVSTDDAGAFEMRNLHPGVYLLRATPNRVGWNGGVSVKENIAASESAARETRTLVTPTYYPGVTSLAEAAAIRVNGEREAVGCDIRVQSLTKFAIRGRLLSPSGDPMANTTVWLKSPDSGYFFEGATPDAQVITGRDGNFEFATVTPGQWHLIAEAYESPLSSVRMRGFASVRLMRTDLEDVTIRLSKPFNLDVAVEGLPAADPRRGPFVHLSPVDGPLEQEAQSGGPKNGKIQVDGVYPGRYRFLGYTWPGYYLDSILLGERDVLGKEVELMEGASRILLCDRNPASGRGTRSPFCNLSGA